MPGVSTTRNSSLEEVRHQFDDAPLPVCIPKDRHFVYANSAAGRLFEVKTAGSLVGRDPIELFHLDSRKQVESWLDGHGRVEGSAAQILNANGVDKDVVVSAWPI